MTKTRVILPCAGYGTRMNMPPNKSKELLIMPGDDKPLIQYHIDAANWFGFEPLIITRQEKVDLINYCMVKNIDFQIVDPKGEWADTVLKSQPYWAYYNILVLPDTYFTPMGKALAEIQTDLSLGADYAVALHQVTDPSKWGIVHDYTILEKPQWPNSSVTWHTAWGVIGFKNYNGCPLFTGLSQQKEFKLKNTSFVHLNSFIDKTRP